MYWPVKRWSLLVTYDPKRGPGRQGAGPAALQASRTFSIWARDSARFAVTTSGSQKAPISNSSDLKPATYSGIRS